MSKPLHTDHNKTAFQIERIAFFSDAVFAIAITLLIIEIKLPALHGSEATDQALIDALTSTIPQFVGFFVSFFVIALYWMAHHRMFRYLHHFNQKLLWTNTVFLLTIVVMPFSTVVYSEYFNARLHVPFLIYTVNIACTGLCSFRLWRVIGSPRYQLSQGIDNVIYRYNSVRALLIPGVFVTVLLLSFINTWIAYIVPPFMPLISVLIRRHYHKKYPELIQKHING